MFGGNLVQPKCPRRVIKRPIPLDIQAPSITPGYYAHFAREPNTDQHVRLHEYHQKKIAFDQLKEERERKEAAEYAFALKYEKHAVKKRFQRAIDDRVKEKLKAYEETIEARRKRLEELLCKEERQYYYETVDNAQKGADRKMEEMKQRAELLKAKREAERLEIVRRKRIEQYRDRCYELRPHIIKKNLIESKHSQLQQMRETESKREEDRELDRMWYELTMKESAVKKEREIQELLERKNKGKDLLKVWDMQLKGKELLKAEVNKVAQEDRIEMMKLAENLRKKQIEELDDKRRHRNKNAIEIMEQIENQNKLKAQRKKEENALDQAFNTLCKLELDREKSAIQDLTSQRRQEVAMYRKYLVQLEQERKVEDQKLTELLEFHRKQIEVKQNEARCQIILAKRKLQCDVLAERAEQLKYKKQEAEQQLNLKEAENELLRMSYETNERLQAESDRLERQAVINYREDLRKQIEYNNVLRQRERDELERQLAKGKAEEEEYRKIVNEMISGEADQSVKHPFRQAIEGYDCRCPKKILQ